MITKSLTPVIIAEHADFVVLEKPAGLLVHKAESSPDEKTLVDWLLKKYPEVKKVGDDREIRPGIVHRLDREASGLMVVARTQAMFEHLKTQFQEHTIDKEYFAIVYGKMNREFGEINLPISRTSQGGRMAAHSIGFEEANEARTEYFVEKKFTTVTLLRIVIHTGRTHQIRVHMFALQHPLVGDSLYPVQKFGPTKPGKSFVAPPRLCLHSTKLGFTDLSGARQDFTSPLPEDLKNYLKNFKSV